MKKFLIIILLLFPITINANTLYWEEPYQDYNIIGTTMIIKNVKIWYVDEIKGNKNACGQASGGGNVAYLIQLSVSDECLKNIDEYFVHELLHIYDTQNKITEKTRIFGELPALGEITEIREKFAYWGSYYFTRPTWLILNYRNEYKILNNYFEKYKIDDLNNYQY